MLRLLKKKSKIRKKVNLIVLINIKKIIQNKKNRYLY